MQLIYINLPIRTWVKSLTFTAKEGKGVKGEGGIWSITALFFIIKISNNIKNVQNKVKITINPISHR